MKTSKNRKRRKVRKPKAPAAPPRQVAQAVLPPDDAEGVVHTIGEAALALGVAPRTLAGWLTDSTFPGKAGQPGCRDGVFPIAAIRAWHTATHGVTDKTSSSDEEAAQAKRLKALIDADRAQLSLERELGSILDAEEQERFLRRLIATAKSLHEELPDRVEVRLPGDLSAEVRLRIRQAIEASSVEIMNGLGEAIAGDQDETEDLPDDDDNTAAAA